MTPFSLASGSGQGEGCPGWQAHWRHPTWTCQPAAASSLLLWPGVSPSWRSWGPPASPAHPCAQCRAWLWRGTGLQGVCGRRTPGLLGSRATRVVTIPVASAAPPWLPNTYFQGHRPCSGPRCCTKSEGEEQRRDEGQEGTSNLLAPTGLFMKAGFLLNLPPDTHCWGSPAPHPLMWVLRGSVNCPSPGLCPEGSGREGQQRGLWRGSLCGVLC